MSAISAPSHFAETSVPDKGSASFHDVTDCVKSWGRRGIFFGANLGFVLGAVFVAIPYSTDVLTFGAVGTLLVGAVECAVIAGGFAALGAALFANGVQGRSSAQFERILVAGRRSAVATSRDVPLADWPARWAYPLQTPVLPRASDEVLSTSFSLLAAQARLSTIEAWENGNTGP